MAPVREVICGTVREVICGTCEGGGMWDKGVEKGM